MKTLLLFLLLSFPYLTSAQTQNKDSTSITYDATLSGTYSYGNSNRFLASTQHTVLMKAGRVVVPMSASYTIGYIGTIQREGEFDYISSPTYDHGRWRVYNDAEYEISRLFGIDARFLIGGGLGYQVIKDKKVSLTVSDLVLEESTAYFDGSSRRMVRNSIRTKLLLMLGIVEISNITFYQPAVDRFDYRFNTTNTVSVRVAKNVTGLFKSSYKYESYVLPGKSNSNILMSIGAGVSFH